MNGKQGSMSSAGVARDLIHDALPILREIVNHCMIPLTVYSGCKHCFKSQGKGHTDSCLVKRAVAMLYDMDQAGYR